jgi:HEAT repeat protein
LAVRGITEFPGNGSDEKVEGFLVAILRSDPDPVVRHEAAFTLGELRKQGRIVGSRSGSALCGATKRENSILVLHEVAEALANFTGKAVISALTRLRRHPNSDVRATAAISLEILHGI